MTAPSQLLDWITAQPWSNGRVGVYGQSFVALTAYAAIASRHPAVEAAFVSATPLDPYASVGYPGGLYARGFGENYIALTDDLDAVATPVDDDQDGAQLHAAIAERKTLTFSGLVADLFQTTPARDGRSEREAQSWSDISLEPVMDAVAASETPVYAIGGWLDIFSDDTVRLNSLSKGQNKLVMRPWHHRLLFAREHDLDPATEARAWFDRWLKDAAPRPESEPGAFYFQQAGDVGTRQEGTWCKATGWPETATPETSIRFAPSLGGKLQKIGAPSFGPAETITVPADPEATSGVNSRWNGVLGNGRYEDLAVLNPQAIRFTSEPFAEKASISGAPVLHVTVDSSAASAVHAFLEYVGPDTKAAYLSEGVSRLVAGAPAVVDIRLLPTAVEVARGGRLRLTVLASDRDNFAPETPTGPSPLTLHLGGGDPPTLLLPSQPCLPVHFGAISR
ncbi:MAG: CocE/NonD family hydrolase [Hyphomonadaceae bacterium]|nr:CocE/NonD family hydrolase [Hyphomonadaceae bacterium]